MKQNDSYTNLVNEFMRKLDDTMNRIPGESQELQENVRELKEMANKLTFRAESIDVYNLNFFFKRGHADIFLDRYAYTPSIV